MLQKLFFLIMSLCIFMDLDAQDNVQSANEISGEDILCILRYLDEDRAMKQSEILSYDNLPGTFWVMAESIVIDDGIRYFSHGYIFLDNKCVMEVEVEVVYSPTIKIIDAALTLPILYISDIHRVMTYEIIDGKIIVEDEFLRYLECYLEDTYLYFFDDMGGYRKYRLQQRFSIYPRTVN